MSLTADLRSWHARSGDRPLPVVEIDHGPSVPGWVLRLTALVPATVLVVAAVLRLPEGVTGLAVAVGGSALVWFLVRPTRGPLVPVLLLTAGALLASPAAPFDPAVWWMAPLGYAALRGAWWAEHVAAGARVELAALARSGRRDLLVTAVALGLGALVLPLVGTPAPVLVVLGGGAVLVLTTVLLRR